MCQYLGDFRINKTVIVPWNTNGANGASITRATNGSIRIYKNNSTTERTSAAGITDNEDFDSLTGVHLINIDLADDTDAGFYAAGNDYIVVLAAATIDGQTVNHAIAMFSIENRSPLMPTTDGRKIDVSSGGEAGVDWANVGSPTTAVGLSGTTVKTATDVETDTQDVQARLPAALGANGNIKADVRDYNGTAGTFASGRPEVNTSHVAGTAQTAGDVIADTNDIQARLPAALVSGRIDASVGAMAANVVTATAIAADAVTEIATAVAAANADLLVNTTLATVPSQTVFTLTAGPSNNNALLDQAVTLYDVSVANNPSVRKCTAYDGATKQVTIDSAPDFTVVAGDGFKAFVTPPGATAPTTDQVAEAVMNKFSTTRRKVIRGTGDIIHFHTDGTTPRGTLRPTAVGDDVELVPQ